MATWANPIHWHTEHGPLLLLNSAVDGSRELRDADFFPLDLVAGSYTVTTGYVDAEHEGYIHRFTRSSGVGPELRSATKSDPANRLR
jgi:hypothetical protein